MPDPSIGAVTSSAPPPMSEEPISSSHSGNETLACVCPSSDGADAADEPGARALVERFGGSQGAGGTGEAPEEPKMPGDAPYCDDDAMRAIGTCTAAAAAAWFTGGVLTIAAGIGCVGALDGYVECLNQERASRKP